MYKMAIILTLTSALALSGCSDSPSGSEKSGGSANATSGEYYSFISGDGDYKVLKVLLVEDELIHVCYYNNVFKEKPAKDVVLSLLFGKKKFDDIFIDISNRQ